MPTDTAIEDYFQQIMGDTEVQEKVLKLQQLTGVQSLQAAAETHANVRECTIYFLASMIPTTNTFVVQCKP